MDADERGWRCRQRLATVMAHGPTLAARMRAEADSLQGRARGVSRFARQHPLGHHEDRNVGVEHPEGAFEVRGGVVPVQGDRSCRAEQHSDHPTLEPMLLGRVAGPPVRRFRRSGDSSGTGLGAEGLTSDMQLFRTSSRRGAP